MFFGPACVCSRAWLARPPGRAYVWYLWLLLAPRSPSTETLPPAPSCMPADMRTYCWPAGPPPPRRPAPPHLACRVSHVNFLQNSLSITLCVYYLISYGDSIFTVEANMLYVWLPLLVSTGRQWQAVAGSTGGGTGWQFQGVSLYGICVRVFIGR